MDVPFDLLTADGARTPSRADSACSRCRLAGILVKERFDAELALLKRDYRCPRCGQGWTDSE